MLCWDDLKPFLAVARAGSTLGASKLLKVSQTTVARRLDALEEAVGSRLFERGQGGAKLTDAGADLLPAAERVEAAAAAFEAQAAARSRRVSGVVRVATSESMANVVLTPAIARFREVQPDIAIELFIADRKHDLAAGEADVAVRGGMRPTEPGLVTRRLMDLDWALYAGRPYVERHGAPETVEAVNDHQLVGWDGLLPALPGYAWLAEKAPRAGTPCRCNSLTNLIHVVRAGLGIASLPVIAAERETDLVHLMPVPREEPRDSAIWLAVHERLRHEPRVRAFMDFLVADVAQLGARARARAAAPEPV